eukprot:m.197555 g.197555  ORF g.197555 m.197555 type:complete len:77 (+) comp17023_c0_seq20:236-466(+)
MASTNAHSPAPSNTGSSSIVLPRKSAFGATCASQVQALPKWMTSSSVLAKHQHPQASPIQLACDRGATLVIGQPGQ